MNSKYEEYKKLINDHLLDFLPVIDEKSKTLYDAMKYSLTSGGKRLRSVLCLSACDFSGGDIIEALPYACAIEYIHTYSLIHDDLPCMDDDDYRRGVLTNHKVYGEAISLLAGDGLLNSAFEIISKDQLLYLDNLNKLIPRIKASYEIAKGAGVRGMISGQTCDIEGEHQKYSFEMVEYLHLNKTGALIKSAIISGLYLGNASNDTIDNFNNYSEYLGLAFQIKDDILDVTSTFENLGKDINSDVNKEKNTFVSILGLEKANEKLIELTKKAKDSISSYYDNAEFFNDLADELYLRNK